MGTQTSLWFPLKNWTQNVFLLAFISGLSQPPVECKMVKINGNQYVGIAKSNSKKKKKVGKCVQSK